MERGRCRHRCDPVADRPQTGSSAIEQLLLERAIPIGMIAPGDAARLRSGTSSTACGRRPSSRRRPTVGRPRVGSRASRHPVAIACPDLDVTLAELATEPGGVPRARRRRARRSRTSVVHPGRAEDLPRPLSTSCSPGRSRTPAGPGRRPPGSCGRGGRLVYWAGPSPSPAASARRSDRRQAFTDLRRLRTRAPSLS